MIAFELNTHVTANLSAAFSLLHSGDAAVLEVVEIITAFACLHLPHDVDFSTQLLLVFAGGGAHQACTQYNNSAVCGGGSPFQDLILQSVNGSLSKS